MRRVLLLVAAGAAAGGAGLIGGPGMPEAGRGPAAGMALVGGAVAVCRRPDQARAARLMGLAGVAWFAGDVWAGLLYVHRGPLTHLLLTYPRGRTRGAAVTAVIAVAYADGVVPAV